MAALTNAELLKALRAEGVNLCPDCLDGDWRTAKRPGTFDPQGIVVHHTASNTTATSLIRHGRSDLPGPLANMHLTRDGVLHLVSNGKCNHAGVCDGDVVEAMSTGMAAPKPNKDTVGLNGKAYGIECNGAKDGKPFTKEMTDTLTRACAAICRAKGWNANHVIGHREATTRKPDDPSGIKLAKLRTLVAGRLKPKRKPSARTRTYTVKKGQTLSGIAAAFAVTVAAIMGVNPSIHDPNKVQPGQVITIPPSAPATTKPTAKPTPKPTATAKPKPKPAPSCVASRQPTLSLHSKGPAVSTAQRKVNIKPDGIFGSLTQSAVKRFQRLHKLTADGVVGVRTWRAFGCR